MIDSQSEDSKILSKMEENLTCPLTGRGEHLSEPPRRTFFPQYIPTTADRRNVVQVTIDMVPDVALIEIFDFYMTESLGYDPFRHNREAWIILTHVCRKWRDIVFGSPSRLNVRILFNPRSSVREMMDTWPPLPIYIWSDGVDLLSSGTDNIVAVLEHNDRINTIDLSCYSKPSMDQALAAMQKPFPSLTGLFINAFDDTVALTVPNLILRGSAPLLRSLQLRNISFSFPVLRNLLLSATDLVKLCIYGIPESRLMSPEAVVACLSGLTRLEDLELGFRCPIPWGILQPPPSTRCVLPALASLIFNGQREYLEHLISLIDTPLLDNSDVNLSESPVFDSPQLAQFIDCTPKLKALHDAKFFFDGSDIYISPPGPHRGGLRYRITRLQSDLSIMVRPCTSSFLRTLIPIMKHLYILDTGMPYLNWLNDVDVEDSQWLDFLRPFTTVKDLYVSREYSPHLVATLHRIIGEGMTEVLPSLQNFFWEKQSSPVPGPIEEAMEQSVAALHRDHSSRAITVSQWNGVLDRWWDYKY